MKKEEKGVDFKIKISDDLLTWFFHESEAFYLLIDDESRILSFSENSLIFFSLKSDYEIGKNLISKFIGDENWKLLSYKINNSSNNTEKALILPEQVNTSYILGAKWKSYDEDNKKRIFIIFKHIIEKNDESQDIEYLELEEEKTLVNHKECLDLLDIPIAIINNNNFYFKNSYFENILQNENIENFESFLDWINKFSINKDDNINIDGLKNNLKIKIKKDETGYIFKLKFFSFDKQFYLIYLLKTEKEIEIVEKEKIYMPTENNNIQNIEFEKITNQLDDIKLELKNEYDNITQNFNIDLEEINNTINQNYNEYEKIITYTSENLISMTKNFNFIEEISVKIHLISINAAIESAKSGEHGKGFAVIAREIAKLSTEIKNYIRKIGNQIENIKEYTHQITVKEEKGSNESPDKFNKIIDLVESTKTKFTNLAYNIIEKINKLTLKD